METNQSISVFVAELSDGMVSVRGEPSQIHLTKQELSQQIKQVTSTVMEALSEVEDTTEHTFCLESVDMSLVVSASGKIGLLGLGAEVGSSSTFRLVFKRRFQT
jgi:hypothetical protein